MKQCSKCKKILSDSEFNKNKNSKDGLQSWCKKCRFKHQKERNLSLKRETMNVFGGRCSHVDKNGVQCSKNVASNLDKLDLVHPNGDGDEHRTLISKGKAGYRFYRAFQKLGYDTGKFVVVVMCKAHHYTLDRSGKKHPMYRNYKKGKFNDPIWLRKRYVDDKMTIQKIAEECGVSYGTILRRMVKFNIERRKPWQKP